MKHTVSLSRLAHLSSLGRWLGPSSQLALADPGVSSGTCVMPLGSIWNPLALPHHPLLSARPPRSAPQLPPSLLT